MHREPIKNKVLWHIYIIELDNRGMKSKYYGIKKCFYVGISMDFGRRMGDYLHKRGVGFVNTYFSEALKLPRYVEYFYGSENEAIKRESQIKKLCVAKKIELMKSENNILVRYIPCKFIIIKNLNGDGENLLIIR